LPDPPQDGLTNFEESVKTRQQFALHERNGHRSCTLVNLANIAVRTGRKLHFDPVSQRFPADEEANRMIRQPMRAPWRI
ncbi:MAG: gfo/Idh/MocA family oxidoreductase, partial [Planctomycetes bacterium]|nr:gfo/Idh/MocA family oxidoreductase [Planctomycetota bacterium]